MSRLSNVWLFWLILGVCGCFGAMGRGPAPTKDVESEPLSQTSAQTPVAIEILPSSIEEIAEEDFSRSAVRDQAALSHRPRGAAQWTELCERGNADVVSEKLCARRNLTSLKDLQSALGFEFVSKIGNGDMGNPAFAFLTHSTSLTGRSVSTINPRVFIFTDPATRGPIAGPPQADPDFVAMAFVRGEPLVEIVARDRVTGELRFFLVRFELACEERGCTSWDVFGPSIESGWTGVTVYDDTDLENTLFDCNVCHQPGGPGTPKMLRMVEQRFPWTHFFRDKDQGKELVDEYYLAHDRNEAYGGVPGGLVARSEPARLEGLVEHEGFIVQPGELPTQRLVKFLALGKRVTEEPTYVDMFRAATEGKALPVPFPDARFVAAREQKDLSATYRDTLKGKKASESFPSLATLHTDEAKWRTGLVAKPGSDGESIVQQMCARCHNGSLDPSVSRARFDATRLSDMDDDTLARAIERMKLPSSSPLKMPPERFGALSEEEIAAAEKSLLD